MSHFISHLCLANHLTRLQAHALDSSTAFYPLTIILFLYVCIQLHNRNFRPIVYCCKPFQKCLLYLRRSIDPKTFSTFIVLSYVKLTYVAAKILLPTYLSNDRGHKLSTLVLYISTNVQFFHKKHLPFAIPSIFIIYSYPSYFLSMFILPKVSLAMQDELSSSSYVC